MESTFCFNTFLCNKRKQKEMKEAQLAGCCRSRDPFKNVLLYACIC